MTTSEDAFRAQVLSMFAVCDSDLAYMAERIVRALQDSGRRDVRFESSHNGALISISQAQTHAHHAPSFREKLDQLAPPLKEQVDAAKARIEAIAMSRPPMVGTNEGRSRKKQGVTRSTSPGEKPAYRCFKPNEADLKRELFPTSQFSGNYMLQRWGGAMPQHWNYGFYRKYGYDGRGAVTAGYHNYPNGERPDTAHLYRT